MNLVDKIDDLNVETVDGHKINLCQTAKDIKAILNGDRDPLRMVKLACIRKSPYAIKYLDNLDDELIKMALREDGTVIQYVKNPTKEQKIIAIEEDATAIEFIEQDKELQLLAIDSGIKVLYTDWSGLTCARIYDLSGQLKNPCKEVQLALIYKDITMAYELNEEGKLDKSVFEKFDMDKVDVVESINETATIGSYEFFIKSYLNKGNVYDKLIEYFNKCNRKSKGNVFNTYIELVKNHHVDK